MSNEQMTTPNSEATNVATDISNDDGLENTIRSEFVIVQNQDLDESSTVDNDKKISSKNQSRRKGGPNAKTINLIKGIQKDRLAAQLEAEKAAKEKQRLEDEREQRELERLRLEKENREKKKQNEKKRIERQKHEGSYLTKNEREKRQRAQVQFEAAGVQIPTRHIVQSTISDNGEAGKKPILYDDQRKPNTRSSNTFIQIISTDVKVPIEEQDSSSDNWEQASQDDNIYTEKLCTLSITEDSSNDDDQGEVSTHLTANLESTDEDDNRSLSPMERVRHRLEQYHERCESHRSTEVLRAPVICVLGHVDAGKTTMLDNLRRTHVQDNEAGGITQQIGATNVPFETICERTKMCRKIISREGDFIVPGLLIIDTPGHEIFKNLRSRGSSLCDLAILVVDLMHGIQQQTIESIQLLTERKTPFIVALNKIDRLYNWKGDNKKDVELVLKEQGENIRNEFEKRCNNIILQFAELGLNVALYYKNSDPNEFYSMVPTSARTGDGMGSLIAMIIETCQTNLAKRISYTDELQATVMEVKSITGSGTTIDVALVNGCISVGDKIIIAGQEGPIVTQIQALLIPESNQELRVTHQYENKKKVQGARGIKIRAKDLEKSMAGLPLFIARQDDEIDYFKNEIELILKTVLNSIQLKERGVYVQASTLGSLEALLAYLEQSKIPCAGVNIGPVHRKDVVRASAQLEKDIQWATILAFDVKIERDAREYADYIGLKLFQDDKFYSLCDRFIAYREEMKKEDQKKYQHLAVFPCKLKILPQCVYNVRDPIICGVHVEDGFIKLGTPICIPSKDGIKDLGRIVSIEKDHKSLDIALKGSDVSIKIASTPGELAKMYGRHFDENDLLISRITRQSIDVIKAYFRDDMEKPDWLLILELKKTFNIV